MAKVKNYGMRKDANHSEIVAAFERLGCVVKDVTSTPKFVDILVKLKRGRTMRLVEIKDPSKAPSARRLTDGEAEFWELWNEKPVIVHNKAEVLGLVESMISEEQWRQECAETD